VISTSVQAAVSQPCRASLEGPGLPDPLPRTSSLSSTTSIPSTTFKSHGGCCPTGGPCGSAASSARRASPGCAVTTRSLGTASRSAGTTSMSSKRQVGGLVVILALVAVNRHRAGCLRGQPHSAPSDQQTTAQQAALRAQQRAATLRRRRAAALHKRRTRTRRLRAERRARLRTRRRREEAARQAAPSGPSKQQQANGCPSGLVPEGNRVLRPPGGRVRRLRRRPVPQHRHEACGCIGPAHPPSTGPATNCPQRCQGVPRPVTRAPAPPPPLLIVTVATPPRKLSTEQRVIADARSAPSCKRRRPPLGDLCDMRAGRPTQPHVLRGGPADGSNQDRKAPHSRYHGPVSGGRVQQFAVRRGLLAVRATSPPSHLPNQRDSGPTRSYGGATPARSLDICNWRARESECPLSLPLCRRCDCCGDSGCLLWAPRVAEQPRNLREAASRFCGTVAGEVHALLRDSRE